MEPGIVIEVNSHYFSAGDCQLMSHHTAHV